MMADGSINTLLRERNRRLRKVRMFCLQPIRQQRRSVHQHAHGARTYVGR